MPVSSVVNPLMEDIDKENDERLQSWSHQEIQEALDDIQKALDPQTLTMLHDRANTRFQARSKVTKEGKSVKQKKSVTFAEETSEVEYSPEPKKSVSFSNETTRFEYSPEKTKSVTFAEDTTTFDIPEEELELDKLQWTQPVIVGNEDLTGDEMDTAPFRFDLQGNCVTEGTQSTNTALYHHGEEPDRPGYTMEELSMLGRSSHLPQKIMAIQILGRISQSPMFQDAKEGARRVKEQWYQYRAPMVLRMALDDHRVSLVEAALNALYGFLSCAKSLDVDLRWYCLSMLMPKSFTSSEPSISTSHAASADDADGMRSNPSQMLVTTDLIVRLNYILHQMAVSDLAMTQAIELASLVVQGARELRQRDGEAVLNIVAFACDLDLDPLNEAVLCLLNAVLPYGLVITDRRVLHRLRQWLNSEDVFVRWNTMYAFRWILSLGTPSAASLVANGLQPKLESAPIGVALAIRLSSKLEVAVDTEADISRCTDMLSVTAALDSPALRPSVSPILIEELVAEALHVLDSDDDLNTCMALDFFRACGDIDWVLLEPKLIPSLKPCSDIVKAFTYQLVAKLPNKDAQVQKQQLWILLCNTMPQQHPNPINSLVHTLLRSEVSDEEETKRLEMLERVYIELLQSRDDVPSYWPLLMVDALETELKDQTQDHPSLPFVLSSFLRFWKDLETKCTAFQCVPPLLKWIYLVKVFLFTDNARLDIQTFTPQLSELLTTYAKHPDFFQDTTLVLACLGEANVYSMFQSLLDIQFNDFSFGQLNLLPLPFLGSAFPQDFWLVYWKKHVAEHRRLSFNDVDVSDWVWPGGLCAYERRRHLSIESALEMYTFYISALQLGIVREDSHFYPLLKLELNLDEQS